MARSAAGACFLFFVAATLAPGAAHLVADDRYGNPPSAEKGAPPGEDARPEEEDGASPRDDDPPGWLEGDDPSEEYLPGWDDDGSDESGDWPELPGGEPEYPGPDDMDGAAIWTRLPRADPAAFAMPIGL